MLVQIKYRMNWPRACQAEWQFAQYARLTGDTQTRRTSGVVIFEDFTGAWARPYGGQPIGWHDWYTGHARHPGGITLFLLQFGGARLV